MPSTWTFTSREPSRWACECVKLTCSRPREDSAEQLSDPQLLDRDTTLGRVLFSFDRHFLIEAVRRQQQGIAFSHLTYAHPLQVSIGACIQDLETIAKAASPEEMANRVQFLPL